jgi:hypothetical protein
MNRGLLARLRRPGLILAALLLSDLAAGDATFAPAFLSPLLAVMLLCAFEFSAVWLAPAALALGLAAELLLGRPHLGGLPVALATAGWLVLRGRGRLVPGHPLGYAAYGLAAGLAARAALLLFIKLAGFPLPEWQSGFFLQGAFWDFTFTGLFYLVWPRPDPLK